MLTQKSKAILILTIFFIVITLIFNQNFSQNQITGKTTGNLEICINNPPTLVFNCLSTFNQSTLIQPYTYECQLSATDANPSSTFTYDYIGPYNFTFNENTGYFYFTPTQENIGTEDVLFYVYDNSNCYNNYSTRLIGYNILDINDPPIYQNQIPDITFNQGYSFRNIFLNDYFFDPDLDPLSYTVIKTDSALSITILPTSEIILSHLSCGESTIIFQAKDPGNLTADSLPPINVKVICQSTPPPVTGGGGGFSEPCEPLWKCEDWGACYPNGTQKKECKDIFACDSNNYLKYFWQECTYIHHCDNKIKDQDEEGVDCGGIDCEVCQTCFDKILNNLEEEVDCGGPNCQPCKNCYDGIQNYGETGIDCGGLCDPCPSCSDGIQNYGETGIDCGGNCPPCFLVNLPAPLQLKNESLWEEIILLSIFLLLILAFLSKLLKSKLDHLISKFIWFFSKKRKKQILLPLLEAKILLNEIQSLEDNISQEEIIKYKEKITSDIRHIFEYLIGQYSQADLVTKQLNKLKTTQLVKQILSREYILLEELEKNKNPTIFELKFFIQIYRTLILDFSEATRELTKRKIEEIQISPKNNTLKTKQLLFDCFLTQEFEKLDLSKLKYIDAMKTYNSLSLPEQEEVYDYLKLTFDLIKYQNTYSDIN
ncbi:MAG: hypothetical protein AB7V77_02430 [Candidatus Woesearchaeota archaeon]